VEALGWWLYGLEPQQVWFWSRPDGHFYAHLKVEEARLHLNLACIIVVASKNNLCHPKREGMSQRNQGGWYKKNRWIKRGHLSSGACFYFHRRQGDGSLPLPPFSSLKTPTATHARCPIMPNPSLHHRDPTTIFALMEVHFFVQLETETWASPWWGGKSRSTKPRCHHVAINREAKGNHGGRMM
jgi:hypothetical protein